MGRPRSATIEVATPERLLSAAEEIFAGAGLERATLADIAARAGITRPSLLYHFATKEQLYAAVVGRAFSSLAGLLNSAMSTGGSFRERLRAVVEGFLTYVEIHPALARIVVRELVNDRGPGRALLLSFGVPIVDDVVAFLEREGHDQLRRDIPVRGALMQIVSDVFLRTAAGDIRAPLWGDNDTTHVTWALARALLLEDVLEDVSAGRPSSAALGPPPPGDP
jgi:AcrR family transcriptional regulator